MSYPFIMQGTKIVILIDNQSHTIDKSHIAYAAIVAAIKQNEWDVVKDLISPKKLIINYGQGNVSIKGETVYWKDCEMSNTLTNRMVSMINEGFSIEPLVLFMENLMKNPSRRAVTELYSFLENADLPITSDGHFLAYKKVRSDFKDIYSSTVLNKPYSYMTELEKQSLPIQVNEVTIDTNGESTVVSMERNQVDDIADHTCSYGLHFCSQGYLGSVGGSDSKIVILKINPRDVVSIPVDYNFTKGRCCQYEIVGELGVSPDAAFTEAVQDDAKKPWFY